MNPRTLFLRAASPDELQGVLLQTDVTVAPLGDSQDKWDVERWAIRRFLATLIPGDLFDFPMRVEAGERPDFVVASSLGTVGVEVTQAVPPDLAKIKDIERRERSVSKAPTQSRTERFQPSTPRWRRYRLFDSAPNLTAAQAREIAQLPPASTMLPPAPSEVLRNWVPAILARIDGKTARFTYPPQARNVLLIDDQWPSPELPEDDAFAELRRHLAGRSVPFDDVFVDGERSQNMLTLGAAPVTASAVSPLPAACSRSAMHSPSTSIAAVLRPSTSCRSRGCSATCFCPTDRRSRSRFGIGGVGGFYLLGFSLGAVTVVPGPAIALVWALWGRHWRVLSERLATATIAAWTGGWSLFALTLSA